MSDKPETEDLGPVIDLESVDPNDLDPTVEDPNPEPITDENDINYVAPAEGVKSRKER